MEWHGQMPQDREPGLLWRPFYTAAVRIAITRQAMDYGEPAAAAAPHHSMRISTDELTGIVLPNDPAEKKLTSRLIGVM